MIQKDITMQSEETEEVAACPGTPSSEKMTFIKNTTIIAPEILPKTDQSASCSPVKFENINLDDDIEKVEVDSHESSSESENLILDDKPEFIPIPDFSTIPEENPNESIKNWLQKITEIQNVAVKKIPAPASNPSTPRVINYQDLPYMGEITLENSKPRRGRKPKKADICHLIYKNYGTIFPGTPNANSYLEKESNATAKRNVSAGKESDVSRSDVQNKIISSLLEKRLTQESKKSLKVKNSKDQNEPLNLCIRDLNQLKIRLMNRNDKVTIVPEIKSEPQSDDDIEIITETPSPSLSVKTEMRFPSVTPDSMSTSSTETPNTPEGQAGGCVYWPNAGIFLHPMALQQQLMMYQRLAGNMNYTLPSHSPRPPPSSTETKSEQPEPLRKIVPKLPKSHSGTNASNHRHQTEHKPKRNAGAGLNDKTPAKRKRSAIFIPPIPTENTTNPATEVSICKFKFTGGAKPSLQEKKMLSVDSGGNFRYYSGTGDKSMRGYEFFPRETLQQQISAQGSSTGAFLQASGEKIYPDPPLNITGGTTTSDFLLQQDLPGSSIAAIQQEVNNGNALRNKKRKTRKSVQREKLEQTFKEKGFLIQTQQLESAEGATYCKFRQLRKFTRYLFRSWKDYLPGNVKDLTESEQRELQQAGISEIPADSIDTLPLQATGDAPNE